MPSVKDFEKNKKTKTAPVHSQPLKAEKKRRPGRDPLEESETQAESKIKVMDVEKEKVTSTAPSASKAHEPFTAQNPDRRKVTFPGSESIRTLQPLLFDLAETIYNDWLDERDFSNLPIRNSQIREKVQSGLLTAKGIEKKLLESPTTEKVLTQVLTYAFKAQETYKNFEKKWKK